MVKKSIMKKKKIKKNKIGPGDRRQKWNTLQPFQNLEATPACNSDLPQKVIIETIIFVNTYINRKPHERDTISNLYQSYTLVVFAKNMRVEAEQSSRLSQQQRRRAARWRVVACTCTHMMHF